MVSVTDRVHRDRRRHGAQRGSELVRAYRTCRARPARPGTGRGLPAGAQRAADPDGRAGGVGSQAPGRREGPLAGLSRTWVATRPPIDLPPTNRRWPRRAGRPRATPTASTKRSTSAGRRSGALRPAATYGKSERHNVDAPRGEALGDHHHERMRLAGARSVREDEQRASGGGSSVARDRRHGEP